MHMHVGLRTCMLGPIQPRHQHQHTGEFGSCALSYEMAVKTASAALLLLENCTPSPQSTMYLHASQEHVLECLASRGAAHFRQRLYDWYAGVRVYACVCM